MDKENDKRQTQQPEEKHHFWEKAFWRGLGKVGMRFIKIVSGIFHWLLFKVLMPKQLKVATKKDIYTVIFKSDTPAGKKFDVWLLIAIVLNIVLLIVDSMISENSTLTDRVHRNSSWLWWTMKGLEWVFTLAFTLEYYLRVYCLKKPWRYVFSFYGLIDFLSIFPAYLSIFLPATQALSVLRLLRLLRIFRIFRIERFVEEGQLLLEALKRSAIKILIFMFFVLITAVMLGTMMFAVEGNTNEAMSSIPKGVYWAVVTLTTVGYGDVTPTTSLGRFISIVVMILGYSIIAVPTGIVAGETIESHKKRKKSKKIKQLLDPTDEDYEEDIN